MEAAKPKSAYPVFRTLVWLICLYHVLIGLVLNLPATQVENWMGTLLGATELPSPQALFVARILGIYMLVFGIGMGLAAWNPIKNRALLSCGVLLASVRAIQRLVQAETLEQTFGVSSGRNWSMVLALLVFALLLLAFRLRLLSDMKKHPPSP